MRYGSCIDGYFGHGVSNGITHGMGYFGFGSFLFFGIVVITIIVLLFVAFNHNKNKSIPINSASEADEVLKLRYVNGEISEEEYQRMKKMIQ